MPQESAPLPRDGCSAARPLFRATGTVLQPSTDDYGDAWEAFEHSRDLSSAFRVSWSVEGRGTPQISLSLLMQARTLGWVGFGLMSNATAHGMILSDMCPPHRATASGRAPRARLTSTLPRPAAQVVGPRHRRRRDRRGRLRREYPATRGRAGFKHALPCLRTAPRLPPWTI